MLPSLRPVRAKLRASRCLSPIAALLIFGLHAPVLASGTQSSAGITDPHEIDRVVADFTGAAPGDIGGARTPADPRLRLASCAGPLLTGWHGTARAAVRVECPSTISGSAPWAIYVATRPASGAAGFSQGAAGPAVKRGDPVTVIVRGRGFSVQQAGEAMENGQQGDWIAIRTNRNAEPVRARIERPGLAIIPAQ